MPPTRRPRLLEFLIPAAALAVITGVVLVIRSSPPDRPADSSGPGFETPEARVRWMERQFVDGPPSRMIDAHFAERDSLQPHTHMGPAYTMSWFMARVEIDPADAPAWAAATNPSDQPRWSRQSHPMQHPTARWALSPDDFDGGVFYAPEPLLGASRRRGYVAGRMLITADGKSVYFWQHWR